MWWKCVWWKCGRPAQKADQQTERGNITFVFSAAVVVVGLVFVASLAVARAVIERSDAQASADAVALAGVHGGRELASTVARLSRVRIVAWTEDSNAVEVTVVLDRTDQGASARAERATVTGPVTVDVWIPTESPAEDNSPREEIVTGE